MPPESNSTKPESEKPHADSPLTEFGDSLINSAIQNPLNSLSQIGSAISGVKLPEMHYFDPAQTNDGTEKFAQQAGGVVGMIVPFMLAHKVVGFGASKLDIEFTGSTLSRTTEQATTGAVMGIAFTPSDDGFKGRLKNGIIDAGTFGIMGAASSKLGSSFAITGDVPLANRIVRSSLLGIGSGIPGGFANAELSSIVNKGQLASASEVRDDVASFALLGGMFGGIDALHNSDALHKSNEIAKPGEMRQKFPAYTEAQFKTGREAVQTELAQVLASAHDGTPMSVLDKFNQSNLSDAQKERVLNALAAVRENHVGTRQADSSIDPDQEKNWIHTQGEFGRNIDSAQRMNLTPEQTEDTLIGSMFSDAVKRKSNFMVHHRDGREAVNTFFSTNKQLALNPERISGIGNMTLEHQIGPPGFMRMIYANSIIADVNLERSSEFVALSRKTAAQRTPSEQASYENLNQLSNAYESRAQQLTNSPGSASNRVRLADRQAFGRFVSDQEAAAITTLGQKIAKPLDQPLIDTKYGAKAVELTDLERSLLMRTGNEDWYVPHESTPWYGASRSLINADSIDNYATPGGFSKLVGMNGPETDIFFRDKTLDQSLASPRRSFAFAYDIMTPEGKALADAELAKTDAAIERARGRTESWLRQELNIPTGEQLPNIPFWNSDLAYPDRGSFENEWWKLHKNSNRTAEEEERWSQTRYTGLTPLQIDQFQFAIKIREQMVDELRREQRVDGSLPPDYKPVMH